MGGHSVETGSGAPALFCARCSAALQPGKGNFYLINIEAIADPSPPVVTADDLSADIRQQIEQLLNQLKGITAQEALDQVYRRLTVYLCLQCCRRWLADLTG